VAHIQRKGDRHVVRYRAPDGRERSRSFRTAREAKAFKVSLEAAVQEGE
jgi:hypothetical protein